MVELIKNVAMDVIEGYKEDGVKITESNLQHIVNEIDDILFDVEGLCVEKDAICRVVKDINN